MVRPSRIGWKARAALARTGGRADLLAATAHALLLDAGGQVLWLAPEEAPLHPRAVLASALPPPEAAVAIDVAVPVWRPSPPGPRAPAARLAAAMRALVIQARALGPPPGFGALLHGLALPGPLDFLLEAAIPHARALARACAADDAAAALGPATALLGLGPGLTPAGDDFVGGVLFARAALAAPGGDATAWARTAAALVVRARTLTHPVSAALLADLAEGHGWAPLHDLAGALAAAHPGAALEAARRLVRLGHSSGWDLLAGVVAGTGALPGCAPPGATSFPDDVE